MIRKKGHEWILYTRDGSRVLGRHDTREEALAQERAIWARRGHRNPPLSTDEEAYRAQLLEHGIGLEVHEGVLPQLCRRLIRSRELGPNANDVNLVAVVRPDVVDTVRLGAFADEEGRAVLILPPDPGLLDAVRDALWVESGLPQIAAQRHERRTSRRTWARLMGGLIRGLSWACEQRGIPLGARSTICHQDKILASTGDSAASHAHDAWVRLRVPVRRGLGFPDPCFLIADTCRECGEVATAKILLGVATLPDCAEHRHQWTSFKAPVPDAFGVIGYVSGEVCLVPCPGSRNAIPGRCLETRNVSYVVARDATLSPAPSWLEKDRPILRPGLAVGRDHLHLWDQTLIALGAGANLLALKCVTCDARLLSNTITGETVPEVAREIRKRLKAYGGFAQAPEEVLDELQAELRPEWGEWLQRFTDAVSMIVCQSGRTIREATKKELDQAERIVRKAKAQERRVAQ